MYAVFVTRINICNEYVCIPSHAMITTVPLIDVTFIAPPPNAA